MTRFKVTPGIPQVRSARTWLDTLGRIALSLLLIQPESGKPPKQKVFSSLLTAPNEVYRQSKWEMMAVSR